MTTVNDLIKYLKKLPSETECSVMVGYTEKWSIGIKEVDMDLRGGYEGNVDFVDYTENPYTKKSEPHYKKKYLTFGGYSV